MSLIDDLKEEMNYVMSLIKLELQKKLKEQGYGDKTTSKLQNSMEIKDIANVMVVAMYMEDYFQFVERRTPAARIPFGNKTGAKISKYIQALFRYWRVKRGLNRKEAMRASFATANVHKKEGRSTRNAGRFSKDGTRHGFIESTLSSVEDRVFGILENRIGSRLEVAFSQVIKDAVKNNPAIKVA